MNIEKVKIESIRNDPENARIHSEKNIEAIAGSLKSFGQRRPLVVWDDIVIAGNGTLEAAKRLEWKTIEIARAPKDWTHDQARAYALADNQASELSEWDASVLAEQLLELDSVGFNIADWGFVGLTPPIESPPPEDFPSFDEETKTQYMCPKCSYEWNGSAN
jgi:ParB-like chromosome segregation protein Spo0J